MLTRCEWELWAEVGQLDFLVVSNLPKDHPVRIAFYIASPNEQPDDVFPEPAKLAAARAAFYAMPAAEQQRVLNGWMPESNRQPLDQAIDCNAAEGVERVMLIDQSPQTGKAEALHMFDFALSSPVSIRVREGTKAREVRAALLAALELVDKHWETIIDQRVSDEDYQRTSKKNGVAADEFYRQFPPPGEGRWIPTADFIAAGA